MKCLICQPIHKAGHDLLRANGIEPVIAPSADMGALALAMKGMDAVITRDAGLTEQAIAGGDVLKAIVVHGTGHNAVDKVAASARGILVANTPGANARSVSELAVGLLIAAARGMIAADDTARAGEGSSFRDSRSFVELSGKTALIVGWGAIGRDTGRMLASAFGMEVLVYSPNAPDTDGFERVTLAEGLARADAITLHTPMKPETAQMINADTLSQVKRGAVLVNVAREGLVDEEALFAALQSGQLYAAGLDVYSKGAPMGPLGTLGNVVFTPHLGAATEDAMRRVAEGAAGHVITALSGKLPATALNAGDWAFGDGVLA